MWINVKNMLPADGHIVIVYRPGFVGVAKFINGDKDYHFMANEKEEFYSITHWMMLPEFPEAPLKLR